MNSLIILYFTFFLIAFFIVYPYVIYPISLYILKKFRGKNKIYKKYDIYPSISVVIAAKNEEKFIVRRIMNLLQLDYPKDMIEIIVISDGSDDNTNLLLDNIKYELEQKESGQFAVKFLINTYSPSKGKPFALNKGVEMASGEIILFADSRQVFDPLVAKHLVANFKDQKIGCISGELCFRADIESDIKVEMGVYWEYEKIIRKLESSTGSVVGATGAIYAIRKELYQPLPVNAILDDVLTPINIAMQGFRIIFEPSAIAFDCYSKDIRQERKRKLRTLAGNWQLISLSPNLLSPFQNPLWWRFLSHKICRLVVPFFLPWLLIVSLLGDSLFFSMVSMIQIGFYLTAIISWVFPKLREIRALSFIYFFLVMNLITAAGFFVWCSGRSKNSWKQ